MTISWGHDNIIRVAYDKNALREHAMPDSALGTEYYEEKDFAHQHDGGVAEWDLTLFRAYQHRDTGIESCYVCRRKQEGDL